MSVAEAKAASSGYSVKAQLEARKTAAALASSPKSASPKPASPALKSAAKPKLTPTKTTTPSNPPTPTTTKPESKSEVKTSSVESKTESKQQSKTESKPESKKNEPATASSEAKEANGNPSPTEKIVEEAQSSSSEEEEEVDEDAPTNSELLQITQHFLLSSPPGQFTHILTDVKTLLDENNGNDSSSKEDDKKEKKSKKQKQQLLTPPVIRGFARGWNLKHSNLCTHATNKDDTIILCASSELDPTTYVHPVRKCRVKVDHLTLTFVDVSDKPLPPNTFISALESKRVALMNAFDAYKTKFNNVNNCVACVGVFSSNTNELTLYLTVEKINLQNCWSGSWCSKWVVNTLDNSVTGSVKIRAHYFEDGNVQLNDTRNYPSQKFKSTSDDLLFSKSILAYIENSESDLQKALDTMYSGINDGFLKGMRRVMPVTRSKMEWSLGGGRVKKGLAANAGAKSESEKAVAGAKTTPAVKKVAGAK